MKHLLQGLIVLFLVPLGINPLCGQIQVSLNFRNACDGLITNSEYSLFYKDGKQWKHVTSIGEKVIVPRPACYLLFGSYSKEGYSYAFDCGEIKIDGNLTTTVQMPRLVSKAGSRSDAWSTSYYNCDVLCDGLVKEVYENGVTRSEGEFLNGKPKWWINYRPDGTKQSESWYNVGNVLPVRTNRYDEKGQLLEYEVKTFKKKRVTTKFFDANGNPIDQ